MTAKVHFVLDEAAALGPLVPIEDALDKLRAYGVRLLLAYQSMGQLTQCWPDGKAQVLLSNTTQIFVGVCDNPTAEYVSARLGSGTIAVGSTGTNSGTSYTDRNPAVTHSSGRSTNWSYQKRELLQPAEVMALPRNVALTFTPGRRPIATQLVRSFEEPGLFAGRGRTRAAVLRFVRAAVFLLVSVGTAGWVADTVPARTHRPPTPSVGQKGNNGTRQKLDEPTRPAGGNDRPGTGTQLDRKGGGTPGRPR